MALLLRIAGWTWRLGLSLVLLVLILLALYNSLGRYYAPLVGQYSPWISAQIQRHTGIGLSFDSLSGQWRKYELLLEVKGLELAAQPGAMPALKLERLALSLDPWASLVDLSPRLKRVNVEGVDLSLLQRDSGSWGLAGFKGGNKPAQLEPLVEFIARLEKLDINSARINLQANSGRAHQLSQTSLLLRQQQGFRRLLLHASGSLGQKLQLNLESQGELSLQDLQLNAKLDWQAIELEPWLSLFSAQDAIQSGALNGESWIRYDSQSGLVVQGRLGLKQLLVRGPQASAADNISLATQFQLRSPKPELLSQAQGWQLRLAQLELALGDPQTPEAQTRLNLDKLALASETLFVSQHQLARAFYWRQRGGEALPDWLVSAQAEANHELKVLWQWNLIELLTEIEAQLAAELKARAWPADYLVAKELPGLKLSLASWQIRPWLQAVSELHNTPELLVKILRGLDLRGELKQLQLRLPYDPRYFTAAAQINTTAHNMGSNAWRGSPELEGIEAYIDGDFFGGTAHVFDSPVRFHLPKLFERAFAIDKVSGRVHWQLEPERVYLQGESLAIELALEQGRADVGLDVQLELPLKKAYGDGNVNLQLGFDDVAIANVAQFLPTSLDQGLLDWLNSSLSSGRIERGDLLLRASLRAKSVERPEVQLYLDAKGAALAYHSDWPAIDKLDAQVWLYDSQVQAWADRGQIYQTQFQQAKLNLFNLRHTQGLETYLNLFGFAQGPSVDVLRFMHQTPIHQELGDFSDRWDLDGRFELGLELQVPISKPEALLDAHAFDVEAQLDFSDSLLVMPELNLQLSDINSGLNYKHQRGLRSSHFSAKLWGQALEGSLNSEFSDDWWIQLKAKTSVEVAALQQWSQLAELSFASGKTPVEAVIDLNERAPMMHLQTQLSGVAIDLPAPIGKTASETRLLKLAVPLTQAKRQWQLSLGDQLRAAMNFDGDYYTGGWLHYGDIKVPQGEANVFAISARLPEVDYDRWFAALEQYQLYTQGQSANPQAPRVKIKANNIYAERLTAFDYEFDNVAMQAEQLEQSWRLNILDNVFSGVFEVSEGDKPLQVELHHMDTDLLEQAARNQAEGDAVFDPRQLIAADFNIHDLHAGKEDWGSWKFSLRPIADGVRVEDIFANVKASEIEGSAEQSGGAEVLWFFNNGQQRSRFIGKISTRNFARVLKEWGYDPFLDSDKGEMVADVSWPGTPLDFAMEQAKGTTSFYLANGKFKETSTAASNTLKVVGILNIDNLLKRLRLDFSDLGGKGLAFEKVQGKFEFNEGELLFAEPIFLDGTASDMTFTGKADLVSKTIDAELGITLPIGGNLSWVAYLASGFSAAVGIYIVSKLLKTQVEKLTSAVYSITGDWNNPDLKFKRLFDDLQGAN